MRVKLWEKFKNNFSIQLLWAFFTMSLLVAILGSLVIGQSIRISNKLYTDYYHDVSGYKAIRELQLGLTEINLVVFNYFLDRDPSVLSPLSQKDLNFRTWLTIAEKRFEPYPVKSLISEIREIYSEYIALANLSIGLLQKRKTESATELFVNTVQSQFDQIYNRCEELIHFSEKNILEKETRIRRASFWVVIVGLLGILISFGLAMLFSVILTKRFIRPIYRLVLNIKGATTSGAELPIEIGNLSEIEDISKNVSLLFEKIKELNAQIAKSQQNLIRSEKMLALGRMAAGLAHEIRNPLTAVKALIYSLKEDLSDNPGYVKDLEVLCKEIDRIEEFIQHFLDFARPPRPELKPQSFHQCIKQTINLMLPQLKKAKIKLALDLRTNNDWVEIDRNQMQQVLVNIIINAMQAMPKGGILTISTESLIDDKGLPFLQVKICDTGPGIDPAVMTTLFDPFVTTKEDGSGLGLAIVHQLVSANKGWVEAYNLPEGGACFVINLPQEKSSNE